jgi:hypothetical protein
MNFVLRSAEILSRIGSHLRECLKSGEIVEVQIKPWEPTRTNEQNAKMWAMLHDIAEQVEWFGQFYEAEAWKDICTAGMKKEQRLVPGIGGGVVALGERTHKMKVREMEELIEYLYWFGAEKGVIWSEHVKAA